MEFCIFFSELAVNPKWLNIRHFDFTVLFAL